MPQEASRELEKSTGELQSRDDSRGHIHHASAAGVECRGASQQRLLLQLAGGAAAAQQAKPKKKKETKPAAAY